MRPQSVFATSLPAIFAFVLLLPGVAHAMPVGPPLRDPQVAISGGGLQAYLHASGQAIDVHTDQNAIQSWQAPPCLSTTFAFTVQLGANSDGLSIGIYDATANAPALFEVFPPQAGVGWFAVVSFRDSPARVIVHLFDQLANYKGPTTYVGGNRNAFGFYLHGPGGEFFTQDARNPAGDPQFLSFLGTGIDSGSWWIAAEDTALGAGADRDFDDLILYIDRMDCPDPVQRSTWGEVKARYR